MKLYQLEQLKLYLIATFKRDNTHQCFQARYQNYGLKWN